MESFIVFALLFGYFGSAFWSCMPLLVAQCVPILSLASAMGMILLPHMVFGPVVMPVLAGVVQEEEGTYRIPMGTTVLCLLISSMFIWGISSDKGDEKQISRSSVHSGASQVRKNSDDSDGGRVRKMEVELS
mgnify:CR=1 FL=1